MLLLKQMTPILGCLEPEGQGRETIRSFLFKYCFLQYKHWFFPNFLHPVYRLCWLYKRIRHTYIFSLLRIMEQKKWSGRKVWVQPNCSVYMAKEDFVNNHTSQSSSTSSEQLTYVIVGSCISYEKKTLKIDFKVSDRTLENCFSNFFKVNIFFVGAENLLKINFWFDKITSEKTTCTGVIRLIFTHFFSFMR